MTSTMLQQWQVAYLCAALLCAAAAIVAGDHLRAGDAPPALTRCTVALTAGALWPVIVVGLLQLLVIDRVVRGLRGTQRQPRQADIPDDTERTLAAAGSR